MATQTRRINSERSTSRISAPTLALPEGGGAVRGLGESFDSQTFDGTANLTIQLPIPTARDLNPVLNLSYSSGSGNGAFGMGFNLALPNIARKTSLGIPKYKGDDVFVLSDQGDLVPLLIWNEQNKSWIPDKRLEPANNPVWEVQAWRPRREEDFDRIEQWTSIGNGESYWQIRTAENVVHRFGLTDNSRIFDPEDRSRVFEWLIEDSQDALGNKVRYLYKAENEDGLKPVISEVNRDHQANRYISEIDYGNYFAQNQEYFAFQVLFDYGEYSLEHPDNPPGQWLVRPDPFSSYRSGFEIRTLRLCRNVLIRHWFYDQFDGKPFLTRALSLSYENASDLAPKAQPSPNISFVKSVTEIGFRKESGGTYVSKSLPPVELTYSAFRPADQEYQQLEVEGSGSIAGSLTQGQYLLADLRGEGLPGLLYSDGITTLQWEPEGNGHYSGPRIVNRFPIERDLNNTDLAITSIRGNGKPDLLVRSSARSGFYRFATDGGWSPFTPFPSVPVDLTDPLTEMIDMNGDGRSDVVFFDHDQIRSYPSLGFEGFGMPDIAQRLPGFPIMDYVGPEEILTFADLFGDGLSHRVRIGNGVVECWPNLGYGSFGAKVVFENAPVFGGALEARRLFLVDLDGSGPNDLVYVGSDHIEVYFNQSGNGFSDALRIPLPVPYDDLSQINFADINGNGTSCLILSRFTPTVIHHCYDFAGNEKPYLLSGTDNQLGATTRIHYSTSVKQYLEDKQAGRTWATSLYFPVQVVEKVEYLDEISKSRRVTKHKYHDGYYDPVEREFRGFGFVETWDTEEREEFLAAAVSDFKTEPFDPTLFVPPTYTRSWFHTGAFHTAAISRQYQHEYWQGDPKALELPDSTFDPQIYEYDSETLREAYVALEGMILRQEIYGLDDSPAEVNPYSVNEMNAYVRFVQPRTDRNYAVFFTYTLESLTYRYERNPIDPQTDHEFTLEVDDFGNVRQSCTVAYPRRQNAGVYVYPEQQNLHAVLTEESFINHVETGAEPYRWIGVNYENKKYELGGFTLPASGYFSFDDLSPQVISALKNQLAYGEPFTQGQLQARFFSWSRSYEWNEDQTDALPLGKISSRGLHHHTEDATLTPELVQTVYGDKLGTDALIAAGYFPDENVWWNRGIIHYYSKEPQHFFQFCQMDGAFKGVDPESSLNTTSTMSYDKYSLLVTETTQYVQGNPTSDQAVVDAVVLTVKAENDYQTMQPWRITDVNGNVHEALYDPLGLVIVTTVYGTAAGQPAGDEPLTAYTLQSDATFDSVINNAETYLQKATLFVFYDLLAWSNRREPACAITLTRQTFVHDLAPEQATLIQIGVTFSDGFGRIVESKLRTDPAPADLRRTKARLNGQSEPSDELAPLQRWVVSGRTVYNNKGEEAEQYLPWFSSTPNFEDQQPAGPPPTVFYYDALDRLIRTDLPKGFFTKVEFSAWDMKEYDEDDTVKDSTFYKNFPSDPITPEEKNERNALDKAAKFYNTPTVVILDNLGREVRTLKNNLGAVTSSDFEPIVSGSGTTAQQLFDKLVGAGYLELDSVDSTEAWVTEKLQPYDVSFQQTFKVQFDKLAAPVLNFLKANGLTTVHELDISGNEIRATDPRLLYSNVITGTDFHNFVCIYAMSGAMLSKNSADAGLNLTLDNVFTNDYWNWSARNFEQIVSYDRLQRHTQVRVKAHKSDGTLVSDNVVETFTYGDSLSGSENLNLRGQIYEVRDQSGIVLNTLYSIQGDLQETSRQFTIDYKGSINWAEPPLLEPETAKTGFTYDVFHQLTSETTPDGSVTTHTYNQAGLLIQVGVTFEDGTAQPIIQQVQYNANGQRLSIVYASGVTTTYNYEDTTLRLLRLNSVRSSTDPKGQPRTSTLQDISYTYDPVGNVTRVYDATYQTVFNNNQKVEPLSDYTYDAIYRLLQANGRQHPGINAATYRNNAKDGDFKQSKYFPLPSDASALETYQETYAYDDAGNLLTTKHAASNSWVYVNEVMPDSNRFKTIGAQNGVVYSFPVAYDNSGNQKQLDINNAVDLSWNCCENLVSARIIERPDELDDSDYYTYDSDEMRTRKVSERMANGGSVTQIEAMRYYGNYDVKLVQKLTEDGEQTILRRQTLRVMDDRTCVAIINNWVQDDLKRETEQTGVRSVRFQLDNHLGSVSMEVDSNAQLISYEEYFPYGGTALIAGQNQQEVSLKVYRYSGQERDDSTGLYYFGARYYAPWLRRWLKPDPAGTVDGLNLYAFVGGNPLNYIDHFGYKKKKTKTVQSSYFEYSGTSFKRRAGKRPTNQNTPKTQKKISARLKSSKTKLPKHMRDFSKQVDKAGKANLTELELDICHVTSADRMGETLKVALNERDTATKTQKRKLEEVVEDAISSDEEDERKSHRKKIRKMMDPKTEPEKAIELGDEVLSRLNRGSRNLRPDNKRPNRGIGKDKDPFLVDTGGGKLQEESRSKGISDNWDEVGQMFGMKPYVPKTRTTGKGKKAKTEIKSSSVATDPKKAFALVSMSTVDLF